MRTSDQCQESIEELQARLKKAKSPKRIKLLQRLIADLERQEEETIETGFDPDEERDPIFRAHKIFKRAGLVE